MYLIETDRLGLRNWEEKDIAPMAAINSNSEVMRYFPSTQDAKQTESFIRRMQDHYKERGFCYFAVDKLATKEMIGFIGLMYQDYETVFNPNVDIGWRLAQKEWRKGYATEGATACLKYGFDQLGLEKIVSVAVAINTPSEAVMQKIGMQKGGDFQHPKLMDDERLRDCFWYEIYNEPKDSI